MYYRNVAWNPDHMKKKGIFFCKGVYYNKVRWPRTKKKL